MAKKLIRCLNELKGSTFQFISTRHIGGRRRSARATVRHLRINWTGFWRSAHNVVEPVCSVPTAKEAQT